MVGRTLAHFRITAKLGEGGMGEVYRAEDTLLGREVALKILPATVATDPDRLSRFEREARLLASLNHPRVAAIHEVGEADGVRFIIMELAEGETLARRLSRGALPLGEALPIAAQVAEALEAAHGKGIVHRDLKPANVCVDAANQVKVLDFGLAAVVPGPMIGALEDPSMSHSPTVSGPLTRAGTLLGTAAYMSPEQARGLPVDQRSDVWALGCVLFEMLTGRPAFPGRSLADVLSAVIGHDPDWSALPPTTPPTLQRLLRRMLARDPELRQRDAADARLEMAEALEESASTASPGSPRGAQHRWLPLAVAAVTLIGLVAAIWVWGRSPTPTREAPTHVDLSLPELASGATRWWGTPPFALSPDGRRIVFVSTSEGGEASRLTLRDLDRFETSPLPGTEGAQGPFFSPDGEWVGFFTATELRRISLVREQTQTVFRPNPPFTPLGATWLTDNRIVFALEGAGLQVVATTGGPAATLTIPDTPRGGLHHGFPRALPGGRHVLFTVTDAIGLVGSRLAVVSLDTGEWRSLLAADQPGAQPLSLTTGQLVYADHGRLLAAPFDPSRAEVTGESVTVLEDVHTDVASGVAHFDVSADGSLVYLPDIPNVLAWVDRRGQWTPLTQEGGDFLHPRLSPDGRRLAFLRREREGRNVWVYDIERKTSQPLTFGGAAPAPLWHPDGEHVTYGSTSISQSRADGTGEPETLLVDERDSWPMSWSPDGDVLAFDRRTADHAMDIWVLRPKSRGDAEPLIATPFNEESPRLSPDGRWLAYISDLSGRYEVYVTPFPSLAGRVQVSVDGGAEPVWAADGRELFYRRGDRMLSVEVEPGAALSFGEPRLLFEGPFNQGKTHAHYDVAPDGQHFVMLRENREAFRVLRLVLEWPAEVAARTKR